MNKDALEFKVRLIDCIARGDSPLYHGLDNEGTYSQRGIDNEDELMAQIDSYGLENDNDVQLALARWKANVRLDMIEFVKKSDDEFRKKLTNLEGEIANAEARYSLDKNNSDLEAELHEAIAEYNWEDLEIQPKEKQSLVFDALETGAWTDKKVMAIFEEWGYSRDFFLKMIESGEYEMPPVENETAKIYDLYLSEESQALVTKAIEHVKTQIREMTDLGLEDHFGVNFEDGEDKYQVDYLYRESKKTVNPADINSDKEGRDIVVIHKNGEMLGMQILPDEISLHQELEERGILSADERRDRKLEIKNQRFLESLEDDNIELIYLSENGVDLQNGRIVPSNTYYDMLCTYRDGKYVDCIPYPVFLAKDGDIERIDSFGELLDTANYTYEESVAEGTIPLDSGDITALEVAMVMDAVATKGRIPGGRYSYLQSIVEQANNIDLEDPRSGQKIGDLIEELEMSINIPHEEFDHREEQRKGDRGRVSQQGEKYYKSKLAKKRAILTQLYNQNKQLGELNAERISEQTINTEFPQKSGNGEGR